MAGCALELFITPTGNQPTGVTELQGTTRVQIACKPWVIAAWFRDMSPEVEAECCEYRQFVMASPIWLVVPDGEAVEQPTKPRWDTWYEDTASAELLSPPVERYGHRDDKRIFRWDKPFPPDGYFTSSGIVGRTSEPDEPAWLYLGKDAPHFSPYRADAPTGTHVFIDVRFKGQIIDTRSEAVVEERQWSWIWDGAI